MPSPRLGGAVALVALVAILAVAACGGDSGGSGGAPGLGQVFETEYKIDPDNLPVEKPAKATLTVNNDGSQVHALAVEGPTGEVKTADIQPGASAKLTVDATKPGRYEYYCPIDGHRAKGMQGSITVGGASGSGGSSTQEDGGGSNSGSRGDYGY
jgi:uncharacterized cupredoxin-like copper-binding protein